MGMSHRLPEESLPRGMPAAERRSRRLVALAGRDISCTHVALGSVRVIRTCGMMGEIVGMAASVCHRHASLPRSVYTDYFQELVPLMEAGAGKQGLPNDQDFCIHGCYDPADPAYRHN